MLAIQFTKNLPSSSAGTSVIRYAARTESGAASAKPGYGPGEAAAIVNLLLSAFAGPYRDKWQPGCLHPNHSWTHYRTLMRVEKDEARSFYEIEALKNHWAARELERQIGSLLYERLALSKDKPGLLKLANKGHQITSAPRKKFALKRQGGRSRRSGSSGRIGPSPAPFARPLATARRARKSAARTGRRAGSN